MIQANELMIGNYVATFGKTATVKAILEDVVKLDFEGKDMSCTFSGIEPILLTGKILENCGLQFVQTMQRGSNEESLVYSIQIANDQYLEFQTVHGVNLEGESCSWMECRIVCGFSWLRVDFWGQPKYLHQLQNLYLALSGQQLTISSFYF